MQKNLTLTGFMPKQPKRHLRNVASVFLKADDYEYPEAYGKWHEISRTAKGINISFEVPYHIDVLSEIVGTITSKNVKAIWAAIRSEFVDKVGYRGYENILRQISYTLGYNDFDSLFTILYDQKGMGFMGGTGCGTKIHHLTYNKITGVLPGLDPLITEVAQAWFNLMLGSLRYTRNEHKHLRDNLREEELFITFGAHPGCQRTVRFVGAQGYPLVRQDKPITCAKCGKS